jgi:hypothetical protein
MNNQDNNEVVIHDLVREILINSLAQSIPFYLPGLIEEQD